MSTSQRKTPGAGGAAARWFSASACGARRGVEAGAFVCENWQTTGEAGSEAVAAAALLSVFSEGVFHSSN